MLVQETKNSVTVNRNTVTSPDMLWELLKLYKLHHLRTRNHERIVVMATKSNRGRTWGVEKPKSKE
jgi:hypothetical protein